MHLIAANEVAGLETVAINIIRTLPDGYEGVCVSPEGTISEECKKRGVRHISVDTNNVNEIRRIYREYGADLIHAHDPRMSYKCARAGVPFISQLHANCAWLRKICPNSLALAYMCTKAKQVISVSDSIQNEFVFSGLMKNKTTVIPNALDGDSVITAANEPYDREYDLIYVGRMSQEKAPERFVEIVRTLEKRGTHVKAVMVGSGDMLEEIRDSVAKDGLDIDFTGYVSNPHKIMKYSRIIVAPSRFEGFGLAVCEAMLLGLPAVTSDVGGLRTLVGDDCGKSCNNTAEMADEITKLLKNREYYKKKSDAASEKARNYTDLDAYVRRITKIYEAAVR